MSQQRILVALCVFAAVAMAAAQSWRPDACANTLRYEVDSYRTKLVTASQKFTSSLQQSAGQAVDTSAFRNDLDKLTANAQQMADLSQGFDAGRFTSLYMESLSSMASITRSSLRLYLVSGTIESYIDFVSTATSAQMTCLQRIAQGCMPSNRVQPTV